MLPSRLPDAVCFVSASRSWSSETSPRPTSSSPSGRADVARLASSVGLGGLGACGSGAGAARRRPGVRSTAGCGASPAAAASCRTRRSAGGGGDCRHRRGSGGSGGARLARVGAVGSPAATSWSASCSSGEDASSALVAGGRLSGARVGASGVPSSGSAHACSATGLARGQTLRSTASGAIGAMPSPGTRSGSAHADQSSDACDPLRPRRVERMPDPPRCASGLAPRRLCRRTHRRADSRPISECAFGSGSGPQS